MCAVFDYGRKPSTFALPANPTSAADKRREPVTPAPSLFYTPEEIEAIARALADGSTATRHIRPSPAASGPRGKPTTTRTRS